MLGRAGSDTRRHKQWWNHRDGQIPTLPHPPGFTLRKSIPREPPGQRQQVNPALLGDASLPWDAPGEQRFGNACTAHCSAPGLYPTLCRSSCERPCLCKTAAPGEISICSLKSQLWLFYTALNTSSSPQLYYFPHFTP